MILADTSAWVEYDRATGSAADQRLTALITTEGPLAVTDPSPWKFWLGHGTKSEQPICTAFCLRLHLLHFEATSDFEAAARIYRRCREAGVTPRGMIDCMIASVAWRRGATLLAHDSDLDRVARVVGIEVDESSLRA